MPALDIILDEWSTGRHVTLSQHDVRILELSGRKIFEWTRLTEDTYKIKPQPGVVGSLRLAERVLHVNPRFPISNLAHLISLAYATIGFPPTTPPTALASAPISEWFHFLLLSQIDELVRRGLRREYVRIEASRLAPRGRLVFSHGTNPDLHGLTRCIADEHTVDTPLNRLIRAGLFRIAAASSSFLRSASRRLLEHFDNVGDAELTHTNLNAVRITSLNQHYEPALRLLELLVFNRGLDAEVGAISSSGYRLVMHDLFEKALANAVRQVVGSSRVSTGRAIPNAVTIQFGQPALKVPLIPDIVIKEDSSIIVSSIHGDVRLVIDAKYRRPMKSGRFGSMGFSNENIYQIFSYAKALRCNGLLVYPRVDHDIDVTYALDGTRFRIATIDLSSSPLDLVDSVRGLLESTPCS